MRLLVDIGSPMKNPRRKKRASKRAAEEAHEGGARAEPWAGDRDVSSRADESPEAQAGGEGPSASPEEMRTRKLIAAAHRVSEEVGQELEAILKTGPSDENLARLHAKIVKAAQDPRTAERIYSAIFAALHPP